MVVYVFIHGEAGITAFTRSVKQLSEHSIDWNVNTGSNGSSHTAAGRAAVFLALHCQLGGGVVLGFIPLKLLIKMLQRSSGCGDLGKWESRKCDGGIDRVI